MSGDAAFPSGWAEEDRATFGEMIARSNPNRMGCGCNAPMVLVVAPTLIIERCGHCGRLDHAQSVYVEGWWT